MKVKKISEEVQKSARLQAKDVLDLRNLRIAWLRAQKRSQVAAADTQKAFAALESKVVDLLIAAEYDPHEFGVNMDTGQIVRKEQKQPEQS